MSIRSGGSSNLQLPVTGGPGDGKPLTFCCWAKVVQHTSGFGSILTLTDNFFNTAPWFGMDNTANDVFFSPGGGTNVTVVSDGTKWFYVGLSWDGGVGVATAVGLDYKGKWTTSALASSGVAPPVVYIGGQLISGGTLTSDCSVLYRGVHVWGEQKGLQFIMDQAYQIAPLTDVTLYSSLWPEKATSNLGYSSVGHQWNVSGSTWSTSFDEPPVPEVVRRRAFSFSTQPAAPSAAVGLIYSPGTW